MSNKAKAAGIAAGLAIFVAVGLFVTTAANKSPSHKWAWSHRGLGRRSG